MSTCEGPGWGSSAWGSSPWGGSEEIVPGVGGIPTTSSFNIYCFGPCSGIEDLLVRPEVSLEGQASQFPVDGTTFDQILGSGGSFVTDTAQLILTTEVPDNFTLEVTVDFKDLPANFTDVPNQHFFFGASSAAGSCAGLFVSKIGLAYAGSIRLVAGSVVVDTPTVPLPGSHLLIEEDAYTVFRLVVSHQTGAVYIYVTPKAIADVGGHQLRYVYPTIPSSSAVVPPSDRTVFSAKGTATYPTEVRLDSLCMGRGAVIPNLPPRADPGADQAVQSCSIVQLDGSSSFDPEGAALLYKWRLIDAPLTSASAFGGGDGRTLPLAVPTGFTNRFYSDEMGDAHAVDAFVDGDVLLVAGSVHQIAEAGTDIDGFYVRLYEYTLADNLMGVVYKALRQRALSEPLSVKPTFYPDVPGLYKFDLTVFDGGLFSDPETVVVNVLETSVARGYVPDLRFLWGYLSDFWKLVEDRERIEVFWGGLVQVAGAELLTLWQHDYAKSLRDIQRTFQRRWLYYSTLMEEAESDIESTVLSPVYGGLESVDVPTLGLSGVAGTQLVFNVATVPSPVVLSMNGVDPFSATQLQALLHGVLRSVAPDVTVRVISNVAGSASRIRIDAPFKVSIDSTNTCPLFGLSSKNALLSGSGMGVGTRSYRVDRSLRDLGIGEGNFLLLDGVGYRIARVVTDALDPWTHQRVTVLEDLPVPAPVAWSIPSKIESPDLNFYEGLAYEGDLAELQRVRVGTEELTDQTVAVLGASPAAPKVLLVDLSDVGALTFKGEYRVHLQRLRRRTYLPIHESIVNIPYLQERINQTNDQETLRRNIDFFLDTYRGKSCIQFVTGESPSADVWEYAAPPDIMWAEVTHFDNRETVESNFGIPVEFTLDDLNAIGTSMDYLSAVRGLWYAHLLGPTLVNLRTGTQILLGLPFAEEAGTILEIRNDFSDTRGRILIQDKVDSGIVRSYDYPRLLSLETNPVTGAPYATGDTVEQFAPLVTGAEVIDYIKDPRWIEGYVQQGLLYEVEKYFTFLVRVNSLAFDLSALLFVQRFIQRVKPAYTNPLFVVASQVDGGADTTVSTDDEIAYRGTLLLFDAFGETDQRSLNGQAWMVDDPRAAGGGWMKVDSDSDLSVGPVYPTPEPVIWGADKKYLTPEDAIYASLGLTLAVPTLVSVDSIFSVDQALDTDPLPFAGGKLSHVRSTDTYVGTPITLAAPKSATRISVRMFTSDPGPASDYLLNVYVNAVLTHSLPFTAVIGPSIFSFAAVTSLLAGDVVRMAVRPATGGTRSVLWHRLLVSWSAGAAWQVDVAVPAGTYATHREM